MNDMRFKIAARIISHLGQELISSDEIAIFELVKNGFDAGSTKVEINVTYKLEASYLKQITEEIRFAKSIKTSLQFVEESLSKALNNNSIFCILSEIEYNELLESLKNSRNTDDLIYRLENINQIEILDSGEGMTPDEVQEYYFTVGTHHRSNQVRDLLANNKDDTPPPSGEKGIGRLSAMRLGNRLEMKTVSAKIPKETHIRLDWNKFISEADDEAQNIPVFSNVQSSNSKANGTHLVISSLNENWDKKKTEMLASHHLAKFMDPFPSSTSKRKIILRWNREYIDTEARIHTYLAAYQNYMEARLTLNGETPILSSVCKLGATSTKPEKIEERNYTALDFSGFSEAQLKDIGSFELYLYHFPRNRLKAIPGEATRNEVRDWLNLWSGGLMIFRDGIRVMPYAEKDDDWLDLDGQALRAKGFRVNRIQVVGCVRISRLQNENLQDQTNREGMIDNEVFRNFKRLIFQHIKQNFVSAIKEQWSTETSDPQLLARQFDSEYDTLVSATSDLAEAVRMKDWESVKNANSLIQGKVKDFKDINIAIEQCLQKKDHDSIEVMELAASGMAAESMAHDLEGITKQSVVALDIFAKGTNDKRILESVRHIRAVHKSVLTQIGQLSPGPAKTRRRRSTFDILKLIRETAAFYKEKRRRHSIRFVDHTKNMTCPVYAVSGHMRQVFDNLFQNSFFWLLDSHKKESFANVPMKIHLRCDPKAKIIYFSDTGCGIAPEDADWIFQPFQSRREGGRGLGLYICREFCEFNKVDLKLIKDKSNHWGRLNVFSLTFEGENS